jgi:hypothetical protein
LLLPVSVTWHSRDILEVELPGSQWLGTLKGSVATLAWTGDPAVLTEDLPDGTRGARQTQTKRLELRIMSKEIEDGFGTGSALEMSGRSVADGKDALDDERIKARRRLKASTRVAEEDEVIIGRGSQEAFSPLLDPGKGAMGGSSVVLEGPSRLEAE